MLIACPSAIDQSRSYPHAAQESQTRRLADLAFMLGDYKLSAAVYEQASRDYKNDRAWRYHSSACVSRVVVKSAANSQLMYLECAAYDGYGTATTSASFDATRLQSRSMA